MAPIRRYLRITRFSVLEVRIYLDKPSEAPWLLSSRDPVLPRIIQEVKPKVLPKLREENENAKKKSGKRKRAIKDVASQHDFEVTIYLTEHSARHSLLTKKKEFEDKPRIRSTGNKLTGWLNSKENPITLEDDASVPSVLREEGDDKVQLQDLPEAGEPNATGDDALFVSSSDEETFQTQREAPPRKRRRRNISRQVETVEEDGEGDKDDKKKLSMSTAYDGFSIYGRILCLMVKRKGAKRGPAVADAPAGGSDMMEQWVSTQIAQETGLEDGFDG